MAAYIAGLGITSYFTHDGRRGPTLLAHGSEVVSVAYSPDGRTLATGSNDGRVRLWNLATGQTIVNGRVPGG